MADRVRPEYIVAVVPKDAWEWLMEDAYLTAESGAADEDYKEEQQKSLAAIKYEYVNDSEAREGKALLRKIRQRIDAELDANRRSREGGDLVTAAVDVAPYEREKGGVRGHKRRQKVRNTTPSFEPLKRD